MKAIDCRDLACPGPVIQTKKAMEGMGATDSLVVLVGSEASRDNVRRFAEGKGASVEVAGEPGAGWTITIVKPSDTGTRGNGETEGENEPMTRSGESQAPPVVLIAGDTVGTGDDKLGSILMEGFLNTLAEQETAPDAILLLNAGVRLAIEGSPVLQALGRLTDKGCEVLVCGTCLDFLDLKTRLALGTVSNMYDMQRIMLEAPNVIRI